MQFEKVQCLVRVLQDGNPGILSVMKSGPGAVSVTEIPILRAMNDIEGGGEDDCSISQAEVVGEYESSGANELNRLRRMYGNKWVNMLYPGGRMLPKTLADCELPHTSLAKRGTKARAKIEAE